MPDGAATFISPCVQTCCWTPVWRNAASSTSPSLHSALTPPVGAFLFSATAHMVSTATSNGHPAVCRAGWVASLGRYPSAPVRIHSVPHDRGRSDLRGRHHSTPPTQQRYIHQVMQQQPQQQPERTNSSWQLLVSCCLQSRTRSQTTL